MKQQGIFKQIQLIYFIVLFSSFAAIIVSYFNIIDFPKIEIKETLEILNYIGIIITFSSILMGFFLEKMIKKNNNEIVDIDIKTKNYQKSFLIKIFLIENTIIVNSIFHLLSSNIYFISYSLILIVFLAYLYPNYQNFKDETGFNG